MLHVLLTILMILGIIIGSILGLLLFLVLIILFVPFRYKSEGSYKKGFRVKASLTWLLHMLTLHVDYDDKGFHWAVKFFGRKLFREKASRKRVARKVKKVAKNSTKKAAEDVVGMEDIENNGEEVGDEFTETNLRKVEAEGKGNSSTGWFAKIFNKIKFFFENLKFTFIKIYDKLKAIKDSWQEFMKFIKDEDNKAGMHFIKEQIFVILRNIKPKRLSLKLRIGFEDPALTGMAVGGLSILYGFYQEKVEVSPDFENQILEGEYQLRGRIRIWNIAIVCLKLFFDKNSNRLLKRFFR